MGLHPKFNGERLKLHGKKALIITTSQDVLLPKKKNTGVYASEMTAPYYTFLDAGMEVDLASIKGGKIPIEAQSLKWPIATKWDKRFLNDRSFLEKSSNSLKIQDVNPNDYDVVFIAGGWGAAYDLKGNPNLSETISEFYVQNKPIGAVCHGPLGLIGAKDNSGKLILEGRQVTGVTNKQIKELRVTGTPDHPETELRKTGAVYESKSGLLDLFQNHIVEDENLVTGQNQNAAEEVAWRLMSKIAD